MLASGMLALALLLGAFHDIHGPPWAAADSGCDGRMDATDTCY
jgi:hypothetical protein